MKKLRIGVYNTEHGFVDVVVDDGDDPFEKAIEAASEGNAIMHSSDMQVTEILEELPMDVAEEREEAARYGKTGDTTMETPFGTLFAIKAAERPGMFICLKFGDEPAREIALVESVYSAATNDTKLKVSAYKDNLGGADVFAAKTILLLENGVASKNTGKPFSVATPFGALFTEILVSPSLYDFHILLETADGDKQVAMVRCQISEKGDVATLLVFAFKDSEDEEGGIECVLVEKVDEIIFGERNFD